jgi:hypothetical protein
MLSQCRLICQTQNPMPIKHHNVLYKLRRRNNVDLAVSGEISVASSRNSLLVLANQLDRHSFALEALANRISRDLTSNRTI